MINNNISRRSLIQSMGMAATVCLLPSLAQASGKSGKPVLVEAKPGQAELLGKGLGKVDIWGYDGGVPGPILRVKQGEEVWVRFKNSLAQPSTIHWHGIRIDNKMDGVAGLTQEAVKPGQTFDYRFVAPDAGTYWYHPHNRTWEQMARGLYGLLIVDEADKVEVDHDIAIAIDDWQLKHNGQLETDSFGNIGERAHSGRTGNTLTVNGKPNFSVPVKHGDRARIRLCNTANSRIVSLLVQGGKAQIVALDGQPVKPYYPKEDILVIAPSQRVDLIMDFDEASGTRGAITEVSEMRAPLVYFDIASSDAGSKKAKNSLPVFKDNGLAKPDLSNATEVSLDMTGGAMGNLSKATVNGEELSVRELVSKHGMIWAFNGMAGMQKKPLFSVKKGQTVVINMLNNTAWPHAIHIHGHHMQEVERKTKNPARAKLYEAPGMWRDTIFMDQAETVKAAFVADNPGKWMIHCHMLEHQAGGMMSWFEVV